MSRSKETLSWGRFLSLSRDAAARSGGNARARERGETPPLSLSDPSANTAGRLTKNLLLKDKKVGTFLLTVAAHRNVDMKTLPKLLGVAGGKANLRFARVSVQRQRLAMLGFDVRNFPRDCG